MQRKIARLTDLFMANVRSSGVKTRLLPNPASMDLNRDTVLKLDLLLDTQVLHPLTSLNMVVCLRKLDLNQPVPCPLSSLQANSRVSKVATVDLLPNLLVSMLASRWVMVALLALVAMVAASQLRTLNGVLLQPRALAMALVATKASVPFSIVPEP